MATRNTQCVWVKLKDCDGVERQPTCVNVPSDGFVDDVIKEGLAVSKVNIAPNLVEVLSGGDSTDPIETVMPVNNLLQRNCGTISSPLFLQCPQWQVIFRLRICTCRSLHVIWVLGDTSVFVFSSFVTDLLPIIV